MQPHRFQAEIRAPHRAVRAVRVTGETGTGKELVAEAEVAALACLSARTRRREPRTRRCEPRTRR
jgi:hypothetical protein